MGCAQSSHDQPPQEKPKKVVQNAYDVINGTVTPKATSPKNRGNGEVDPDDIDNFARKESGAVSSNEPSDFVAKVKQMYHVRKAKLNGANEDVNQYEDEIRQSFPTLTKRDITRIQEWVDSVGTANPGDVYDEIPELEDHHKASSQQDSESAGRDSFASPTIRRSDTALTDSSSTPDVATTAAAVLPASLAMRAGSSNKLPAGAKRSDVDLPILEVTNPASPRRFSSTPPDQTYLPGQPNRSFESQDAHDVSLTTHPRAGSRRQSMAAFSTMHTPRGCAIDATDDTHNISRGSDVLDDSQGVSLGWLPQSPAKVQS